MEIPVQNVLFQSQSRLQCTTPGSTCCNGTKEVFAHGLIRQRAWKRWGNMGILCAILQISPYNYYIYMWHMDISPWFTYNHDIHVYIYIYYIYITHCIYRYSGGHDIVLWNKTCYLSKVYSEITTSKLLRMSPTWESCKTMVFWQSQKVMIDDTDIWIRWKIYGRGNIPWKPRSFRLSVRYLSIDQSMYICIIYVLYMCASV